MAKKGCDIRIIGEASFKLTGMLDEYADLSVFSSYACQQIRVDLSEVMRINSSGVRTWIQAIMRHKVRLILMNCSPPVVEQFSMISEFIGKDGYVESLYVHFVCDACDVEEKFLLRVGHEVQLDKIPEDLEKTCKQCGEAMECEHNKETYFSFLENMRGPTSCAS